MKKITLTFTADEWLQIYLAVAFIQESHKDQLYGDRPYWTHPVEVANELVEILSDGEILEVEVYIGALLHDVVEDTGWSLSDLAVIFPQRSVDIVALATKDDNLDYKANIQRIIDSGNVDAMRVKLADNRVNSRGDKSKMKPARAKKLNDRYAMSMNMLGDAIDEKTT